MNMTLIPRVALAGVIAVTATLTDGRLSGQVVITSAPTTSLTPPAPVSPVGPFPSFEVASVKKAGRTITSMGSRSPGGGRITVMNLPVKAIIAMAWGFRDYQIIGGPGWLTTDRFTITAKAEDNAPRDRLLLMLRSLLEERFQLRYRIEKREFPTYTLLLDTRDGKPSPKLRQVDCAQPRPPAAPPAAGAPVVIARPAGPQCGGIQLTPPVLRLNGATMATFASLLGSIGGLGQVVDKTGLTGTYAVELEMSLGSLGSSSLQAAAPGATLPPTADGPSVFAAVRDIGLRIDRRRDMVDAIIIEDIQQPDED
jgi:uncharacterized protein (TIGR03435 family)